MNGRNFQTDFCAPAMEGMTYEEAKRIGIALDAAIAFGVLEYLDGNESLQDRAVIEAKYQNNVSRLRKP